MFCFENPQDSGINTKVSASSPSAPYPFYYICPLFASLPGPNPTPIQPWTRPEPQHPLSKGVTPPMAQLQELPMQGDSATSTFGTLSKAAFPSHTAGGATSTQSHYASPYSAPPLFPSPSSLAGTLFLPKWFSSKKCRLVRLGKKQWANSK